MKNNIVNLLIQLLILLCSVGSMIGQEEKIEEVEFNKNALLANIGIYGLNFSGTAYYERLLTQNNNRLSFAKVGVGSYEVFFGHGGSYILAQYGIFTGVKKHHFELGAGYVHYFNGEYKGTIPLTATMGWRIQKPGGRFMFRMGVSWPEGLYVGVGIL